jgi:hypothetical protein
MNRCCSLIKVVLAFVALATIVGHVCAVPGHAHAATMGHHDHGQPAHDHPDGPDGAHIASCDAVRSPSATQVAPLPIAVVSMGGLEGIVRRLVNKPPSEVAVPTSSPPLYLAHRSLLI